MKNSKSKFLYQEIYLDLRTKILNKELVPGERLRSENELKDKYHVSRDTIRKAMELLKKEGLITRKPSIGTVVSVSKMEYEPSGFHESFSERMKRLGLTPTSEILSIEILSELDSHIENELQLKPGEKTYKISRIRKANDHPMALEIAYIPVKFCPQLHTKLSDNTSLYDLYENYYHISMGRIDLRLEAETGDSKLLKVLKMHQSTAILKISSLMHLKSGEPFYYVISYHVGSEYSFTASLPRSI